MLPPRVTAVPVPKASVDEDDLLAAGEDEVGCPGEIPAMKPETIAESVRKPSDNQLRLCIRLSDGRHQLAATGRV